MKIALEVQEIQRLQQLEMEKTDQLQQMEYEEKKHIENVQLSDEIDQNQIQKQEEILQESTEAFENEDDEKGAEEKDLQIHFQAPEQSLDFDQTPANQLKVFHKKSILGQQALKEQELMNIGEDLEEKFKETWFGKYIILIGLLMIITAVPIIRFNVLEIW